MKTRLCLALACASVFLYCGLPLPGQPNGNHAGDACLLSFPAIGPKHIAFVYSDDLWVADLDGQNPRRLTSDLGVESHPVFSPDGSLLAFSAQYDGNVDVYTLPVSGGTPTRLTYHPMPDLVRGFTPDGKQILFNSPRHVYSGRHMQLFTVPLAGGMPTQLPLPWGFEASYSPDGEFLCYSSVRDATPQWKNYRGGTHGRLWVYNTKNHEVEMIPQPAERCNDHDPQWVGGQIFFRSDRQGEYNVFSFDPTSKEVKQITRHSDFPVLDLNSGGGKIIYEQSGYLHVLIPGQTSSTRLKVPVATDRVEARPRFAKGSKYVRGAAVSPSGARAAVEFRGDIVTVPAEKGDPRNLTNSPGVHDREPSWSPDGKTLAYFSDEGGEYQLVLRPQDGKGEVRKLKLAGGGFYSNQTWSRDSKKILFNDNGQRLYWIDVATGQQTKIADPKYGGGRGNKVCSWSPDSKWVAYSMDTPAKISQVFVYSLEKDQSFPITDGLSEAVEPVFDANGKHLWFLGSNDSGMSKHGFAQSSSDARPPRWSLYVAILGKDDVSPFAKESDEEKGEAEKPEGKPGDRPERKDEPKIDEAATKTAADDKDAKEKKTDDKVAKKGEKKKPEFKIDLEGIENRILAAPVPSGSYMNLQAGSPGQVYYLSRPETGMGGGRRGEGMPSSSLNRFDLEKRKADVVQAGVMTYELTPNGKKMLVATGPGSWSITSTSGGGMGGMGPGGDRPGRGGAAPGASTGEAKDGKLNLEAIEVRVEPQEEWKQILHEAWRINRDFFYDPGMHGADWEAVKTKYEAFLPHCTNSGDLYRVIRWMLSELAVGHSYTTPGERVFERKSVPGGLLGADYEIANGRYRFKKIYGGLNWTPDLRSPLTAPGVNVKAGEYLLAVRGVDLRPPTELYSLFENTAGKSIELTVGPNPDGTDSRVVTVEPIASEMALRNREWVEGNLKRVQEATQGRVGYIYVPDTAGNGLAYFKRYFFPQVDKEALIVDERSNGGGQIADYYIDLLRREFTCYWAPRYGADWRSPSAAVHGPKVMLIDEGAGSGGDLLPWMFRKYKIGPLVGKRTWGGLVGISGYPVLMDGGNVTAPGFAFWSPEEGFSVENEGVAPDYDVEMLPKDVIAGKDPQLEKAIQLVMAELEKKPKKTDSRPAYPTRAKRSK